MKLDWPRGRTRGWNTQVFAICRISDRYAVNTPTNNSRNSILDQSYIKHQNGNDAGTDNAKERRKKKEDEVAVRKHARTHTHTHTTYTHTQAGSLRSSGRFMGCTSA